MSATGLAVAVGAIIAGGGMLLTVLIVTRRLANHSWAATLPSPVEHAAIARMAAGADGVLVARRGGRVLYANERARKLFELNGGAPDVNRLASLAEPPEAFYELLAGPGETRLHIGEHPVEARSLPVDGAQPPQFVVVLRAAEPFAELAGEPSDAGAALAVVAELNQIVAASLNVGETLAAVLKLLRRALTFDLAELWLWDADQQRPTRVRRTGEPSYVRALDRLAGEYDPAAGIPGWIARERRLLLVADTAREREPRTLMPETAPIRSALGVPLEADGALIGTLHIAARDSGVYEASDTMVLETIGSTAAVALRNAQRFAQEQTRLADLTGLIRVAQTSALISDARELNGTLSKRIAGLMEVAICGLLLYDDEEQALLPQAPFHGIPDMFVESLRIPVPPGSAAEKLWREQAYWFTNRFATDPAVDELGLSHAAGAFGLENALLVPLIVGGRRIGAIEAANKAAGKSFGDVDARRLAAIAGQAAALVDNARLVHESGVRARLAEATNRIADLTGARAPLAEIIAGVAAETAEIFDADFALVFMVDEARGELSAQPDAVVDRTPEAAVTYASLAHADAARMDTSHPSYKFTVTGAATPYYTAHAGSDETLNLLYRPTRAHLEAEAMLLAPLIVSGRGVGELWLASRTAYGLRRADLPVLATIGAHLAAAIERNRLGAATDESLRRRVEQLSSLTRVSRELNRTLDLDQILQAVYDEALRTSGAVSGNIVLLDLEAPKPHVRQRIGAEATGAALTDLEREVAAAGEGRLLTDLDPADIGLPAADIRSGLIVPIAYQNLTVGLIELFSQRRDGFDEAQLDFIRALAGHAAIAVGNAQRYEEQLQRGELLRRRADQLAQLLRISRSIRSDRPLAETLESIVFGMQEAVGFGTVSISVLDAAADRLEITATAGLPLATFEELKARPATWEALSPVLQDEFQISQSYFVPRAQRSDVLDRVAAAAPASAVADRATDDWQAGDLLLAPLTGSGGQPLGLITLEDPRNGRRPARSTVETVEIFANQAALAIENVRLYEAAEQRATELAESLQTVQQSYRELDAVSRSLQEKDAELNKLVERLDLRNKRLLAVNHIATAAIGAASPGELLQTAAEQLRADMQADVAIFVEARTSNAGALSLKLASTSGKLPAQVDLQAVLGGNTLLTQVVSTRTAAYMQHRRASQWADDPLVKALDLRSFAAAPFQTERTAAGALLAGSRTGEHRFSREDLELFNILAQQVGLSLQNSQLLAETQELQASTEAVFQSIQLGIVVLNTSGEISSLNDFMRRRYGWDDTALGQALFAYRPFLDDLGLREQLAAVMSSGEPFTGLTVQYPLADADPILTNASGYALRRAGAIGGAVLLLEDISARAQLEADVRARAAQLEALTEVSRVISSALRVEEVVSFVLEHLGSVIPFDSGALWLRDGDLLRVAAAAGFADDEDRIGLTVDLEDSALFNEVAERHEPIVVADVRADKRFPGSALLSTRSWMGVPLLSKDQVLGLIALDKAEIDYYNLGHVELARGFANQAAVALENARLFEESIARAHELKQRSQRLQLLNRLSSQLGTTLDRVHALSVAVDHMARAITVESAAVIIFDDKRKIARLTTEHPRRPHPPLAATFPLENNALIEHLRESAASLAVEDVASEPLLDPIRSLLQERNVRSVLITPLNAGGRVIGFIQLEECQRRRRFNSGEVELAQTIANQSAIAVQNARLFEDAQQRLIELDTINHIARAVTATMDLEQLMHILRDQVMALLETENVYVALYDEATDEVSFPLYYRDGLPVEVERMPAGGLTERIIRSGEPLRLTGKLQVSLDDPKTGGQAAKRMARSYFGLPLKAGERTIGVITVINYERYDAFTSTHERILNTLAAQVAVAIENARLFGEVRAAAEELEQRIAERTRDVQQERDRVELLLRMTSELSASLDLDSVLTRSLTLVKDSIGATQGSLFLIDPQSDGLIHRASLGGAPLPPGGEPAPFGRRDGLIGWVLRERAATLSGYLPDDERWREQPYSYRHQSALAAPVVSGGDLLGALVFYSDQSHAFSPEQLQLVAAAANQVASAVNNSELYRLIRDQAERLGGMFRAQQVESSKSRAILEAVADGVMVSDSHGSITLFNRSAELILKLERDKVVGRPISEMIGVYGAAGHSWLKAIERWRDDPDAYQPGDFLAERFELDSNRIVSVHIAPVIDDDEFIGSVSLFRDITRDVEVDRLKTEFVTTVSHELRTPMTSIKGYADLMLSGAGGPLEGMQREFMETIKSNADRLRVLVEDLLDVSKIETGKVELNLTLVDVQAILKETVRALRDQIRAGAKEITVIDALPDSLPPVRGDEVRLAQIFRNLVDNAYTYTPGGGEITLRARVIMDTIQIDVQDNGIGLAPGERARIFDRFYRGENPLVLASSGTGLGLNIVQQLVEMHGGQIWVDSAGPGTGSTFSVLIPTAEAGPLAGSDKTALFD